MTAASRRPEALSGRLFRGSEALRRGLLTPADLRGSAWIKIRHDVYADARLPLDHELACRAALARLPTGTVVAGPSAAFRHGVRHAATYTDDVYVIAPTRVRIGAQRRLSDADGVGCGEVARSDRRGADRRHSAAAPPDHPRDLAGQLDRRAGGRGCRPARLVAGLADPGAQSPAESRLRVRLVLAGLPRPVTQCPVPVGPVHSDSPAVLTEITTALTTHGWRRSRGAPHPNPRSAPPRPRNDPPAAQRSLISWK